MNALEPKIFCILKVYQRVFFFFRIWGFVLIYNSVTLLTNSYIESLKSPRLSTVEVT